MDLLFAALLLLAQAGSGKQSALFREAEGSPYAVGRQPAAVALGDVNGDGKPDILTANAAGNSVSVLLGDGRGGFREAPGSPVDAGPNPHWVALGDFNGDTRLDVAVTEHDSTGVRVYLGDGKGGFSAAPGSPFVALSGKAHNHGLTATDVNRDGKLDLLTSNQDDLSVSVLLGNGRGGFSAAPGSPFRVAGTPYPHAVGDVNGDSLPDIVAPNVSQRMPGLPMRDGSTLSILLGDGKGGFRPAPGKEVAVASRPFFVAMADVNGDAHADLLVTHDDVRFFTVLLSDGKGGFRPAPGSPVNYGALGWKIVPADLDGDGRTDVVIAGGRGGVVALLGDGTGQFTPAPGSPFAAGKEAWAVAVGDLNGDGKPDVVAAHGPANRVTVLLGR
jgi:hypothetical protein